MRFKSVNDLLIICLVIFVGWLIKGELDGVDRFVIFLGIEV